jgi:hypothetical protein
MYVSFSDNFLHNPAHDQYFALGQTRMQQQVGVPAHGGMILTPMLARSLQWGYRHNHQVTERVQNPATQMYSPYPPVCNHHTHKHDSLEIILRGLHGPCARVLPAEGRPTDINRVSVPFPPSQSDLPPPVHPAQSTWSHYSEAKPFGWHRRFSLWLLVRILLLQLLNIARY